jgi:hypothetical protein
MNLASQRLISFAIVLVLAVSAILYIAQNPSESQNEFLSRGKNLPRVPSAGIDVLQVTPVPTPTPAPQEILIVDDYRLMQIIQSPAGGAAAVTWQLMYPCSLPYSNGNSPNTKGAIRLPNGHYGVACIGFSGFSPTPYIREFDANGVLVFDGFPSGYAANQVTDDLEVTSSGNFLYSASNGTVLEFFPTGYSSHQVVWSFSNSSIYPTSVHRNNSISPNTLVGSIGQSFLVSPSGVVLSSVPFPGWVQILPNGNYLIYGGGTNGSTVEVTPSGLVVWSYYAGYTPGRAKRLVNGNTLITKTFGHAILEINALGAMVWSYGNGTPGYGQKLLSYPKEARPVLPPLCNLATCAVNAECCSGYVCSSNNTCVPSTTPYACINETDNGNNSYVKGSLQIVNKGGMLLSTLTDYCSGSNSLVEYNCQFPPIGTPAILNINCAGGCLNGACIPCGFQGTACCPGVGACNSGLICNSTSSCSLPCGVLGGPCCSGNSCNSPFVCSNLNGTCVYPTPTPTPSPTPTPTPSPCPASCTAGTTGNGTGYVNVNTTSCVSTTYMNSCTGSSTLVTYSCSGTSYNTGTSNCPYGCSNGQCLPQPSPTPTPGPGCNDTDGPGTQFYINYTTQGTATGPFGSISGTYGNYADFCTNSTNLVEHYCTALNTNGYVLNVNYNCANNNMTCSAGRCQ